MDADDVIMIGDDVMNDVGGAQRAGMRAVLVRTGKYRPCDEQHETVTPDLIVDSFSHFVDLILESNSNK